MSDIATGCVVFGILLTIGGFIAYSYVGTVYLYGVPVRGYPYRDFGIPVFIMGIITIIVGAFLFAMKVEAERTKQRAVPVPLKKCPKCGIKYRGDEYCPACGVKLEQFV